MQKYYNAKYDLVFKNCLCSKGGEKILIAILEEILECEIEGLEILNNNLDMRRLYLRGKVVDCLIKTKGKRINIEINNGYNKEMKERNFGYLATYYSNQIMKGSNYIIENEYIQINLSWNSTNKEAITTYLMTNIEDTSDVWTKKFKIVDINMEKIKKIYYNETSKSAEKYKYLLMLDLEREDLEEYLKGDEIVEEFKDRMDELNSDEEFVQFVTEEEDNRKIRNTLKEIGLKEGEIKSKKQIALNMLKENIDIQTISKVTGLSVEEIKML